MCLAIFNSICVPVLILLNYPILTMSNVSGTRSSAECPIFGYPKEISWRAFPTYEVVMKYYQYVRLDMKQGRKPSLKAIATVVVIQLENLWKYASILHLSRKRITSMLRQYRTKMNNLLKSKCKYQVLAKAKRAVVKSTMIMECLHKQKEKNGMFLTYLLSLKLAIAQEFHTELQHFLHHLYYRMPALSQKKMQHQLLIRTKFKEQERRLERTIWLQAIPLFI